ncbi:1-phosphatidylinositol 4,5-bisphosphate phosphodiesterase beta-4 isoform X1 [Hydra vulgaris]|uniref:1-phosphatidylinositol 4,5-bisphosphate phosphodiesterase beta-4 isoform X1 n=2 Tax=Hydra vulgaris TaxID=6087 RepID=UPI001F5EC924|nr:1-phosphatidylinositol 4,5-bisphosphate phosphodiesterase beta-4-like isoform X1 [Hydra vulgaris]
MAGAGPISETLPVVSVPSMLVDGGRFLKWDDQDLACSIYILEVDQLGHVLSWKPEDFSKDTEVLDLVHVRDVRTGQYAKVPKPQDIRARDAIKMYSAFEHESNLMQERTITIVYGSNFVDLTFINFVASSVSEAQEWTDALFKCTNNLLEFNSSPLKCLERFFTRIYVQKNQEGEIPTKILVKAFVNNKEDKKRAYGTLQSVGIASGKKETILVKDFTFERFLAFYNRFVTRHDLDGVFAELGAKNKPYLTTDQLVDFLNNRQRDPRLNEILFPYYDISGAQAIVNTYEPNKAFADKGYISIDGLTKFLMSSDANILLPGKLQIHQDLTFPVAHYFINSSHNTYLQGHQLTGKSSVEIYRQVLLAGCRCIELDCWDGRTEEQEPVITHGMTLCTEVPFKDVIEAIKESAFKTSEYPVILSFENHCSAKQQKKMASYCLQIFGDLLLNKELEECPLLPGVPLPSPKMLKRKILIKNKKRDIKVPVSETKNSNLFAQSIDLNISGVMLEISNMEDIPEDGELKEVVPKSEEEETPEVEAQQELSELVNYFQPVHFRGFERAEKVKRYYEMSSFSENAAMNLLKEQPVEFVNYNKFQASRIYPKGSRVSSDNYIPQLFWNAGCQLVALNFQTLDVPMQLNLGKFEINGRCGYLLKPEHMRRHDRTFDPFVESTVDGIIAGTVQVRVISGQCLLERRSGTYVEVEMYGLPADTVRRKYRTKVVSNNGLNPVYDEEPFKFKVILPHLAELRISVYEENGKMIGHRVLPVDGLSPGYRHIKLRNESYQPLCLPTLFVDIVTKDYVPESFSDFADALSNPMKYLSEKEKRTQQLEAFEFEESDSTVATSTPEFLAPELQNISAIKRGSIVSLQTIINQDKRDKRDPGKIEIKKNQNDSLGNRTQSEVFGKPESPVETLKRTFSTPSSQDNHIRHDILKISAPSIDTLKEHKLYKKLQQKFDTDFLCLMQKQAKERILYRKELEVETKKLTLNVERQKSAMQKNHNKLLKIAQAEGNYNEVYNNCLAEIKQLNIRHEQEIESLMNEQKKNMKEQFIRCYEEQYDFLKNKVEPKISELKKILHMFEVADRKKLDERHLGDMMTLKKDQDKFNRGELKDIMRKSKDKLELQKMKRVQNKKHIEQSVIERQSMKEFQEKETQILIKKYEEQINILDQRYEKEMKELEQIFAAKCALLDSQDLQVIVPDLANNVSDVFTG